MLSESVTLASLAVLYHHARSARDRGLIACVYRCARALGVPEGEVRDTPVHRGETRPGAAARAVAEAVRERVYERGAGDIGAAEEIERRCAQ